MFNATENIFSVHAKNLNAARKPKENTAAKKNPVTKDLKKANPKFIPEN